MYEHDKVRPCPAASRSCRRCGKDGHFSRSDLCKKKQESTTKKVEEEVAEESDYAEANYSSDEEEERVLRVDEISIWPGVRNGAGISFI